MGLWYSPGCILEFADQAVAYFMSQPAKSKSRLDTVLGEARAGAFLAMSIAKQKGIDGWMRLVDPSHQAPDVEVMHIGQQGKYQTMEILGVEVATYSAQEKDTLGDFLLRTKLNPEHAYGRHTAIVIYIQKTTRPADVFKARQQIADVNLDTAVFLLGQADDDLFQIQVVYPALSARVDVRISEALDSPQARVAEVSRGMSKELKISLDPIHTNNPFMAYVEDS